MFCKLINKVVTWVSMMFAITHATSDFSLLLGGGSLLRLAGHAGAELHRGGMACCQLCAWVQ